MILDDISFDAKGIQGILAGLRCLVNVGESVEGNMDGHGEEGKYTKNPLCVRGGKDSVEKVYILQPRVLQEDIVGEQKRM